MRQDRPTRLEPRFCPKDWGKTELSPWFGGQEAKIGEVEFRVVERNNNFPRIKFLFIEGPLSVQVHPEGCGEAWIILQAKLGTRAHIGIKPNVSKEELEGLSLSGEVLSALNSYPVTEGRVFSIPAGVVHTVRDAILCEIKVGDNRTFRLYDFERPRDLHLPEALQCCDFSYFDPVALPSVDGWIQTEYFAVQRVEVRGVHSIADHFGDDQLLVVLSGSGSVAAQEMAQSEVWLIPAIARPLEITGNMSILRIVPGLLPSREAQF